MTGPLQWFARGFGLVTSDLVDAEQFLLLLQRTPTVQDLPDAKPFVAGAGSVEFKDVSFSYDTKRPVIYNFNLHAQPGQTIALVGKSGGGKSTILKLLFRSHDVTSGQIRVDDQNIRDVTLDSFRPNIGVVPQDPALFNDTVLNNILYGRLDARLEEVVAACKAVALHERILSFTNGYEEVVGEHGVKMSGGELQRMAIARVILMDPKILLLDEATSSVDSETETIVQESLRSLSKGRTTFVNAHRLSTIVHADLIVVLDEGRVVERGTHAELLKLRGHYYGLWTTQGKGIRSERSSRDLSQEVGKLAVSDKKDS